MGESGHSRTPIPGSTTFSIKFEAATNSTNSAAVMTPDLSPADFHFHGSIDGALSISITIGDPVPFGKP